MLACLSVVCQMSDGANVVREVRKTIKEARYQENGDEAKKVAERLNAAEKSLMDALPEEKKAVKRAGLYYTAALVQCRVNDIENEKIYLKRAYDTVLFYNSIYKTYTYLRQCDSVEATAEAGGRFKYRPAARKLLLGHRANLLNGGRFFLRKKDYKEAYRFLDLYLASAEYPMFAHDFLAQEDTMYARVAYWIITVGYRIGEYGGVARYASAALRYGKNQNYIQEYLCRSYLALNDTASWMRELKKGAANFPDHVYFFSSLQKFLLQKKRYDDALQLADRMVQYDPKNSLSWFYKALVHMRKGDFGQCVANCDVVLILDSANYRANYFKGLAYCNMAKEAADAMAKAELRSGAYWKYRTEMITYYALAEEPLERARKLAPDKAARWAPLLYQVYLNQNKGEEFEGIERVMRDIKEDK